jgi:hypothetical protein
MARPLRIEFAGALYHLTSRGDRRESIYEDEEDRQHFLDVLAEVVDRYRWICHAYCLMMNYYHLVVETVEGNLSQGMRPWLLSRGCPSSLSGLRVRGNGAGHFARFVPAGRFRRRGVRDTHREISEHFGVHLATVGRLVRTRIWS